VQQFLKVFLDIVLWRRGPQDLPASGMLLGLTLAAYVFISVVQLALIKETPGTWAFFLVVDPLLLMTTVWLVLKLYGKPERFVQSASAVLGTSALLGLIVYLPLQMFLLSRDAAPTSGLAQIAALLVITAFALVTGRIIQRATDSSLFTGIAVALTYFMVTNTMLGLVRGGGG
jgi:uncharacterized membrane protein SirB2